MKTTCSMNPKASLKARVFGSFGRMPRRCSSPRPAIMEEVKGRAANELQKRFMEIGVPEEMMMHLQITDLELVWDDETQRRRDQFLKEGHILVVDRSSGVAKTRFLAPPVAEAQVA